MPDGYQVPAGWSLKKPEMDRVFDPTKPVFAEDNEDDTEDDTEDELTDELTDDQKVIKAIEKLDDNNRDHWTKQGKPNSKILSEMVGFKVTNKMRDAAFKEVQL